MEDTKTEAGEATAAETAGEATGALVGETAAATAEASGESGALSGKAAGGEAQGAAIDYDKMTDDEYLGKVALPEGQKWDKAAMGRFAPLLRESRIPPEVFAKFVALDAQLAKEGAEAEERRVAEENKAARAAFAKAGEEFRAEFSPEQVRDMNDTLAKMDDETFKALVTKSPLSNSKTMGRMLLAYRKVYGGEDTVPNGKSGASGSVDFVKAWTGTGR